MMRPPRAPEENVLELAVADTWLAVVDAHPLAQWLQFVQRHDAADLLFHLANDIAQCLAGPEVAAAGNV